MRTNKQATRVDGENSMAQLESKEFPFCYVNST